MDINKLFAPFSYRNASDEQIGEVCNGCGTGGWKGKLVPGTMYGLCVRPACDVHDWMYNEGSTADDKTRADRVFLNNMVRLINKGSGFRPLKWLRLRRANKYYLAVKCFGGPAFWADKNIHLNLIATRPPVPPNNQQWPEPRISG